MQNAISAHLKFIALTELVFTLWDRELFSLRYDIRYQEREF